MDIQCKTSRQTSDQRQKPYYEATQNSENKSGEYSSTARNFEAEGLDVSTQTVCGIHKNPQTMELHYREREVPDCDLKYTFPP